MLSIDRAAELGITQLVTAIDGRDEEQSRLALSEVARASRAQLDVTETPDAKWIESVTNLLLNSQGNSAPELRAECLLNFGQWYYKEGQYGLGLATAEKAAEIAEAANLPFLQRWALSLMGIMYGRTKDIAQSTLCYVKALEVAERTGDRYGQCAVLINLADARYNAGMLHDAITLNEYVIELAEDDPKFASIKMAAHHNIALAANVLQDIEKAKIHIEEAIRTSPEPKTHVDSYSRTLVEVTFAKILVKLRDVPRAEERVALARRYAEAANSAPARVSAHLAETLCDAAAGRTDIALTRLDKLEQAIRGNEPLTREALEVGTLVNDFAGRRDESLAYAKRYLKHLAEWQRKTAVQQVAALKKTFRREGPVSEEELLSLPGEIRHRFSGGDEASKRWASFRTRMEMLAVLAELRDDATGEHSFRVGRMSSLLAERLEMDQAEVTLIELAARLHDIGKLAVPDVILLKRARLQPEEIEVMRRHATEGCQILLDVLSDAQLGIGEGGWNGRSFKIAAEIALHHHEWWDGTGYPRGVYREAIPRVARITALADVFDALTHERPYKKAWPIEAAIAEILSLSGKQFDPAFSARFIDLVRELQAEYGMEIDDFLASEARSSPLVEANRAATRVIDRVLQEHRAHLALYTPSPI